MKRLLLLLMLLCGYNSYCSDLLTTLSGMHQQEKAPMLIDQAMQAEQYATVIALFVSGSPLPISIENRIDKSETIIIEEFKKLCLKVDSDRLKRKKKSQSIANNFYLYRDQRLGKQAKKRLLCMRKKKSL